MDGTASSPGGAAHVRATAPAGPPAERANGALATPPSPRASEEPTLPVAAPSAAGPTRSAVAPLTISIVMATYHRPHTIHRTIEQIVAQTYPHWELIVVDNASDGAYRFDDPRIHVYRHAERASASYARNCGLRHASGDLLCFFDDDDDMFPTYLERFASAFRAHPEASLVRCGMYRGDGQINFTHSTPSGCIRRALATPTWSGTRRHDIRYWSDLISANGWSEARGDIVLIPEILLRARSDPEGGLRSGSL